MAASVKQAVVKRLEKWDQDQMAADASDSTKVELAVRQRKTSESLGGVANGGLASSASSQKEALRMELLAGCVDRKSLVLWRRPVMTLRYFFSELFVLALDMGVRLWRNRKQVMAALLVFLLCTIAYYIEGSHQKYILFVEKKMLWCAYWVGLGVLSSVGLGTGLHTFLLYLGPYIAGVTLAAHECGTVDFPEPPYPDEIICPEESSPGAHVGILKVMSKVRLEAFMWGAGTALGELPPYFMARAARLSGNEDLEDLEELEELIEKEKTKDLSILDKAKLAVEKLVERVGFLGILACASIPNPLFDLAGITCGHFLVPFWTFFGATLIGKAIIKMHIQKLFVIIAFNENHVELLLKMLRYIPYVGRYLQAPFKEFLAKQKAKLHRKVGSHVAQESSLLAWLFEKLVLCMIVYFVLSIINSMAQSYHRRLSKGQKVMSAPRVKVAVS
ncbi:transport and Golgi organization 5 isoform X1 [Dermacentor variabilis]|uniref:transport and Golgi organization 5 isoform X1 n=1 Tax=Dermacentor variabilis TaxID=34621 RepID=UPI003F5B6D21